MVFFVCGMISRFRNRKTDYTTEIKKFLLISSIILSGCSQNIANFTLVSTESTNLDNEYESIGQIEGVDIAYIIVVIPTGTPRIDEAVKNALLTNNADYITNTVIKIESFYFPYIGGYSRYKVKGEGWRMIDNVMPPAAQPLRKIKGYKPETGEPIYE
jgi:hypothetical protein